MRKYDGRTIFSASDLVNFMGCEHASVLDLGNLDNPTSFAADDESATLLQEKGIRHEQAYLHRLKEEGRSVVEIPSTGTLEERSEATRRAMQDGHDVIYQGAFLVGRWHGYSDFLLRRDDVCSSFGPYAYDVADTKLARTAKAKHVLQLCVYADMLAEVQGVMPPEMHVVLGSGDITSLRSASVLHYFHFARQRFEAFADMPPVDSAGDPCSHCTFCRWSDRCKREWDAADHLSIVAGMGRGQIVALRRHGIADIGTLAATEAGDRIDGVQPATIARLSHQARLQQHYRQTGERRVEVLPDQPGRGFARLPRPDHGDMFFDMEGDPLFDGGLEYLFGLVAYDDDGQDRFHEFWGHDRASEKVAFERTIAFMLDRLSRFPAAHIYHYAAYEQTALKKLARFHGTCEDAVDDLLRRGTFVDLYRVVAESVRTSEPRYSIKNMEAFYLPGGRQGEVKNAGESIVIYERWRRLGDERLLREIADYNEIDCRSTRMCRDWLLCLRPAAMPWFERGEVAATDPAKAEARTEAAEAIRRLVQALTAEDVPWRHLLADLLEFHRREAKSSWWAMFERQDMDREALLRDAETLAGLMPHPTIPARKMGQSMVHSFTFPAQDFKLKAGDSPLHAETLETAGEIVSLDEVRRLLELKQGRSRTPLEPGAALIPAGPFQYEMLRAAIQRYAEHVAAGGAGFRAITAILRRDRPRLAGRAPGQAIVAEGVDATTGAVAALLAMDESYLLIQGPPGAGKTYTSSQAIVALLAAGKRIGIASNSHKAINNLLAEVEETATARNLSLRGMKKSSRPDQALGSSGWIEDVIGGGGGGVQPDHQLVAGTAWLFARPELEEAFDYLFIDEAGQVSLANIVAMGVSARNIVLVGDQMQLSQPITGTHPGSSGMSALNYLLDGHATVPPEQGVFLPVTRRMHPDLCRFISAAVYEDRLEAEASTVRQCLELDWTLDPEALAPAGLRFVDVAHSGCAQRSQEEADRLAVTYRALLGGRWTDRHGETHRIEANDILVVSPYNMQVELLKRTLPEGARVGTVDKFQGQEAPVVLVSMATSSGEDLPRNIEFLYSRNRLNVAISRAKCLAVIYASPKLLEIPCSTIAQMELVDGLCWARQFADEQRVGTPGDRDERKVA